MDQKLGTSLMIVGFGGSNSTVFPSLFASGQKDSGTMPLIDLKKGTGSIPDLRYGDYYGSAVDPTDTTIRWIGGEFVVDSPPPKRNNWSTAISKVTLESSLTGSSLTENGTASTSADGTQPQAFNATSTTTPPLTEEQQQLVCSDGFAPDPSTGVLTVLNRESLLYNSGIIVDV